MVESKLQSGNKADALITGDDVYNNRRRGFYGFCRFYVERVVAKAINCFRWRGAELREGPAIPNIWRELQAEPGQTNAIA